MRCNPTPLLALAALSLSLLGSAATPALAIDDDVDFVCYDTTDSRGNEDLECQSIGDFKADCAFVDPDHLSDECKMLDGEPVVLGGVLRAAPPPPQSLAGDGGADEPTAIRRR